ncbi:MAG: amidohydrolase [Gemmatimonadota bacterium]|nr:amidohydrolase [Gemmatimonadota bacterium]
MTTDVNAFIGGFPFRHIPHPDPEILTQVLAREKIDRAWVGHLPSAFYRDPSPGNELLFRALEPHRDVLAPAPAIRPDWPKWRASLDAATARGAAAIRAYPAQWAMGPHDASMRELIGACGERGVPLLLTIRFEDLRQRHWMDGAGDVSAAHIRDLARVSDRSRIVVTAAGRGTIEEVHWGLTAAERDRVWWDISWIWGPPSDDLEHLLRTVGPDRFVFGTGWPLRLTQNPRANLDLLPDDLADAAGSIGSNLASHLARKE